MPGDAFSDIYFPDAGVDAQAAVGAQRPGTTPTGVNTRACEPSTRRLRGGARSGLSKYVDARPGGLTTEIQHLAVVVDHSADYLLAGDEANPTGGVPPSWVSDPSDNPTIDGVPGYPDPGDGRNPGRSFPPGGSGVVPDPHVSGPEPGSDTHGWVFVQKASGVFAASGVGVADRTDEVAFADPVTRHQFLAVAVGTQHGPSAGGTAVPDISVTDSLGNTYTQLDVTRDEGGGTGARTVLAVFYCRPENGGACTVQVTQSESASGAGVAGTVVTVIEYGGLETTTPFEHAAGASGSVAAQTEAALSPGAVEQGGATRLCLCVVRTSGFFYDAMTPADGFAERDFQDDASQDELYVLDDLSTPSGSDVTPAVTWSLSSGASFNWCAVAGTFRYR